MVRDGDEQMEEGASRYAYDGVYDDQANRSFFKRRAHGKILEESDQLLSQEQLLHSMCFFP